jgi:hypothetical protein
MGSPPVNNQPRPPAALRIDLNPPPAGFQTPASPEAAPLLVPDAPNPMPVAGPAGRHALEAGIRESGERSGVVLGATTQSDVRIKAEPPMSEIGAKQVSDFLILAGVPKQAAFVIVEQGMSHEDLVGLNAWLGSAAFSQKQLPSRTALMQWAGELEKSGRAYSPKDAERAFFAFEKTNAVVLSPDGEFRNLNGASKGVGDRTDTLFDPDGTANIDGIAVGTLFYRKSDDDTGLYKTPDCRGEPYTRMRGSANFGALGAAVVGLGDMLKPEALAHTADTAARGLGSLVVGAGEATFSAAKKFFSDPKAALAEGKHAARSGVDAIERVVADPSAAVLAVREKAADLADDLSRSVSTMSAREVGAAASHVVTAVAGGAAVRGAKTLTQALATLGAEAAEGFILAGSRMTLQPALAGAGGFRGARLVASKGMQAAEASNSMNMMGRPGVPAARAAKPGSAGGVAPNGLPRGQVGWSSAETVVDAFQIRGTAEQVQTLASLAKKLLEGGEVAPLIQRFRQTADMLWAHWVRSSIGHARVEEANHLLANKLAQKLGFDVPKGTAIHGLAGKLEEVVLAKARAQVEAAAAEEATSLAAEAAAKHALDAAAKKAAEMVLKTPISLDAALANEGAAALELPRNVVGDALRRQLNISQLNLSKSGGTLAKLEARAVMDDVLKTVNEARKAAGKPPLAAESLPYERLVAESLGLKVPTVLGKPVMNAVDLATAKINLQRMTNILAKHPAGGPALRVELESFLGDVTLSEFETLAALEGDLGEFVFEARSWAQQVLSDYRRKLQP